MFCFDKLDTDRQREDTIAKKIENYIFKYDDVLGKGNFGEAFRGFDVTSGMEVAIKVVKMSSIKSKTSQRLLQNEIQILKNLPLHANILKCQDVFTSVNNCYMVTELCEYDLQKELHKRGKFRENQIKDLVFGIYKGLEHLALNFIVHRDIKISNIFLTKTRQPKIADFGFAIKANYLFKDVNIGSPLYMSPQGLIYRQYGPKTDVWSFGVLLYELLTGETPLEKCKTDEQLKHQILKPPIIPPFISHELKEVIQKCLTIDQNKRPSIFQLGKLPYFVNLKKEIEFGKTFGKEGYGSNISTECSLKLDKEFVNPYFFQKPLNYDNGLSILHYCRLLHKINMRYFDSNVFFYWLMNLSNSLCGAQFSTTNVFNEQLTKMKEVLKEYHKKFKGDKEDRKIVMNPREMLPEICRLIGQETSKDRKECLEVLDAETKVLIYALEHKNADILTKNSEAKAMIESGQLKI